LRDATPGTKPAALDMLRDLAGHHPTAVISRLELIELRRRVGLPQLFYLGNHGLEIAGPSESDICWEFGADYRAELDDCYEACLIELPPVAGLVVEHRRYALSVCTRRVAAEHVSQLDAALAILLAQRPRLRARQREDGHEIEPAIDWHRGKALRRLRELPRLLARLSRH